MNQARASEDRVLEALAKVPVFSSLDARNRRKLARLCTLKSFDEGDVLYEEGALGLGLFIVASGRVQIYKNSDGAGIDLGSVAAGGGLGQLALLDDLPRAASVKALELTECLLLTRDSFDTLVRKEPQIAWCLTQSLAGRVRDLQGLAVKAELARTEPRGATEEATDGNASEPADATEEEARSDGSPDDDDEPSALEYSLLSIMRMQYGFMAAAARGMTEAAKTVELFLESVADEVAFESNENWVELLGKIPEAMMAATRSVVEECEKVPEEMVSAYRRYGEGEE